MPVSKKRFWLIVVIFGFAGQIAWMIENMYFNVFLYNTVTQDPKAIATMVAASAIVATITTLLIGPLSDKLGKRKIFLVGGYILWGLSTMVFAWLNLDLVKNLFPGAVNYIGLTTLLVILMDCVMTFFGSTANDAVFNAYITEQTQDQDRGKVEGVLSAFPLLAMLVIFALLDPLTQAGRWDIFFILVGLSIIFAGVLGIFIIPKDKLQPNQDTWLENIIYGFKPSVLKANPRLVYSLLLLLLVSISMQVFMPYILIYIQNYLEFNNYVLLLGITLIGAAIISVLGGRLGDKVDKIRLMPSIIVITIFNLIAMYFARTYIFVTLVAVLFMGGFLLLQSLATALVREHTPNRMAGRFQGIRMLFAVLLPMLIGPFIGASLISNSQASYEELGQIKQVPTPNIFIGSAGILGICLLMVIITKRKVKKNG